MDSLAHAFAETIEQAERLSGRPIEVVYIVGGGSQNALLCQLTADACRRPVVAGPVEATALGNVVVQARTLGAMSGDLPTLRERIRSHRGADPLRAARAGPLPLAGRPGVGCRRGSCRSAAGPAGAGGVGDSAARRGRRWWGRRVGGGGWRW